MLTNKPEALALPADCALLCSLDCRCLAAARQVRFDVILAADCLYSHGTAGAFCDALERLVVRDATRVLMCCEERWSRAECEEVLLERGWGLVVIGSGRPTASQLAKVAQAQIEMGEGECRLYEAKRRRARFNVI